MQCIYRFIIYTHTHVRTEDVTIQLNGTLKNKHKSHVCLENVKRIKISVCIENI